MAGRRRPWMPLLSVAATAGALSVPVASCQTPTQIVVDIETDDPAICAQLQTTLVFASSDEANVTKSEQAAQRGCQGEKAVGTVVLLPKADTDEDVEVLVLVVSGLTKLASACFDDDDGFAGCISAKQRVRFVPNQIVHVRITMSRQCRDVDCGDGTTCDPSTGQCGAIGCANPPCQSGAPPVDAAGYDVAPLPRPDAGPGPADGMTPPPDTGPVPGGCETGNGKCAGECVAGKCVVACSSGGGRCTGVVCQPGVPCAITCDGQNSCSNVSCGEASSCEIHCKDTCGGDTRCGSTPGPCTISCETENGCNGKLYCSTNPASDCQVTCAATCANAPVLCCGDPECNVAPSFTKDPSTVCQ